MPFGLHGAPATFQRMMDRLLDDRLFDASDRGVGAVLSQCDESGSDQPVAYFSRKLLPREERYKTWSESFQSVSFRETVYDSDGSPSVRVA